MQNFTALKLLASLIAVITVLFLSSCINDVDNSQPTQFQINMQIQSVDSTIAAGADSLNVESVRFALGKFEFETDEETLPLKDSTTVAVLGFESQNPNFQNPRTLTGGSFPANNYQSINISFPKAPEGNSGSFDPDFYGDDGKRYTIVVEGTFNGSEFTYSSERVFNGNNFDFPLSLSSIPEEDAFFLFSIQTDVRIWFAGGQGFLDPGNAENSRQINDNIGQSFRLEQDSSLEPGQ